MRSRDGFGRQHVEIYSGIKMLRECRLLGLEKKECSLFLPCFLSITGSSLVEAHHGHTIPFSGSTFRTGQKVHRDHTILAFPYSSFT